MAENDYTLHDVTEYEFLCCRGSCQHLLRLGDRILFEGDGDRLPGCLPQEIRTYVLVRILIYPARNERGMAPWVTLQDEHYHDVYELQLFSDYRWRPVGRFLPHASYQVPLGRFVDPGLLLEQKTTGTNIPRRRLLRRH